MNKIYSLLLMLGLFTSLHAQTSIIKTSPGALAFGVLNACYEKVLSPKGSFEISGSYFYKLAGIDVSSFGLGAGYKAYVTSKESPRGFYIMPNVGFSRGSTAGDVSFGQFNIAALLGYQIIGGSGFTFDGGIGPSYSAFSGDADNAGFDGGSGILPQIRLAVGYAW